jgi:GTP-binding protein LepA
LSARPTISYKIIDNSGKEYSISSTEDWPNPSIIKEIKEPWAKVEIITPQRYFNDILQIFPLFKINFLASKNFGQEKLKIYCEMPFRKLIENFYDKLKNVSQGFASINFKVKDWRKANLSKLDILIAKEREPALAKIVEDSETEKEGRIIVKKLKEIFPPQLFALPLQAAVGGKIIARETIKARRKDVTGPLYGGDITRKMKLLRKQKKGKKRLEKEGKVRVPNEVIIELLK